MTETPPVLPYLRRAHQLGWATVLACPNTNFVMNDAKASGNVGQNGSVLAGSESARSHVSSLWEHIVRQSTHQIFIVAHSSGGSAIVELACKRKLDFVKRVRGVALLDSVHKYIPSNDANLLAFFRTNACNFVTSNSPLGCEVRMCRF